MSKPTTAEVALALRDLLFNLNHGNGASAWAMSKERGRAVLARFDAEPLRDDGFATCNEIDRARQEYCLGSDDNIEIDDEAKASRSPETTGLWVQAWVWLAGEDTATDEERSTGPRRK